MTQQITPLPPPPQRGSAPDNFSATADAFLAALPAFAIEANALVLAVASARAAADTSASNAHDSAEAAADRAEAAAASVVAAAQQVVAAALQAAEAAGSALEAANSAAIAREAELGNVDVLINDAAVSATRTWSSEKLAAALMWHDTTTAVSKTLSCRERCSVVAPGLMITLPGSPGVGAEVIVAVADFADTVIDGGGAQICGPAGMDSQATVNRARGVVGMYFDGAVWRAY